MHQLLPRNVPTIYRDRTMTYTLVEHQQIRTIEATILQLRRDHPLDSQVNVFLTSALCELDHADRYIQWRIDNP